METRIVFMGTPEFAVPILRALVLDLPKNYRVVGVVTKPDKKVGRKQILTPSPIKEESALYNIPVFQPKKIKEEYQAILDLKPDLIITCAYGQILPKEILDYPKYKCINVHASLLPKLRGGAPIHHAIIDGYEKTGVTIMYMDEKMDEGDILTQAETKIKKDDTLGTLEKRLSEMGKELLLSTIPPLLKGEITPIPQKEEEATYGYNITKEEEKLDFNKTKEELDRQVRGLNPIPGSYAILEGKRIKIYDVRFGERFYSKTGNGTIVDFYEDGISVVANHEELILTDIAVEGKKRCLVKEFLHGLDKSKWKGKRME